MDQSGNQKNRRLRWWVTIPALALPLMASFFYFVVFPGTAFGNAFYAAIKVFLLVWPVVATAFLLKESFRRMEPWRGDRKVSMIAGIAFGVLVVGLMLLLQRFTPFGEVLEGAKENIRARVEGLGMLDHYVLFAVFLSVVHSALEEFYWRWFAFGNLRRLIPVPAAHAIAGLGFASHHIVVTSQFFPLWFAFFLGLGVALGGMVWSWNYQRYQSLLGAWISHMIVDIGIFWIGYGLLFHGAQ